MTPKGLTPKIFASWMLPHDALTLVTEVIVGAPPSRVILERLKGGLVKAAAIRSSTRGVLGGVTHADLVEIPGEYWEGLLSEDFWNSGDAHFNLRAGYGVGLDAESVRCFGIRIEPTGIEELVAGLPKRKTIVQTSQPASNLGPTTASSSEPPREPSKAGRPRKDFWDALWIEICSQMYVGELKPDKQAKIEKAMLDWASANDHELSNQAARTRARMLLAAISKKDKN
jgi:hypothetical protein